MKGFSMAKRVMKKNIKPITKAQQAGKKVKIKLADEPDVKADLHVYSDSTVGKALINKAVTNADGELSLEHAGRSREDDEQPAEAMEHARQQAASFQAEMDDDGLATEQPVVRVNPEEDRPPGFSITITADIGRICATESSRYAISDVRVYPDSNGATLAATDGRMLAIVEQHAVFEGTREEREDAGLDPQYIPRDIARPRGKSERQLHLKRGRPNGLFDDGQRWVEDTGTAMIATAQPGGGTFPQFSDLFKPHDDSVTLIPVDTSMLVRMAHALNSVANPGRGVLMLMIRTKQSPIGCMRVDGPIHCIGDSGCGLVMPLGDTDLKAYVTAYEGRLKRLRALEKHAGSEAVASIADIAPPKGEAEEDDQGEFGDEE
jgi:hypothetical protein